MKNRMMFGLALCLFICLLNAETAESRSWYVDNAVTGGSNLGTSWENAKRNLAALVWGNSGIGGGDTVFISGGEVSKTYPEQLHVDFPWGATNLPTAANPIVITIGKDEGHDGVVTITNSGGYGIYIQSEPYIHINGEVDGECRFRVTQCRDEGIFISGSHHVKVTHVEVDFNGQGGGGDGIELNNNADTPGDYPLLEISYCKIHDNYQDGIHGGEAWHLGHYGRMLIHHNEIYNINDDGIEIGIHGLDIYDNVLHTVVDNGGSGHPDAISLFYGYARVYNNMVYNFQHSTKVSNSALQPGFFNNGGHTQDCCMRVFNNLIYQDIPPVAGNYNRGIELTVSGDLTEISDVVVANNTVVGMPWFGLIFTGNSAAAHDVHLVNNVFHNNARLGSNAMILGISGETNTYGSWGDAVDVVSDYNVVSEGPQGRSSMSYKGTFYDSYAAFKSASTCEDHGLHAEPLLDAFYQLTVNSPAKDKGVDMSAYFTVDKNGTARPQEAGWDIGAFEYSNIGTGDSEPGIRIESVRSGNMVYPNPYGADSRLLSSVFNSPPSVLYDLSGRLVDLNTVKKSGLYLISQDNNRSLREIMIIK